MNQLTGQHAAAKLDNFSVAVRYGSLVSARTRQHGPKRENAANHQTLALDSLDQPFMGRLKAGVRHQDNDRIVCN